MPKRSVDVRQCTDYCSDHGIFHLAMFAGLARLIRSVRKSGRLLILDERSNIQGFKDIISACGNTWDTKLESRGNLFLRRD